MAVAVPFVTVTPLASMVRVQPSAVVNVSWLPLMAVIVFRLDRHRHRDRRDRRWPKLRVTQAGRSASASQSGAEQPPDWQPVRDRNLCSSRFHEQFPRSATSEV